MVWIKTRPPVLYIVALLSLSVLLRSLLAAVPPVLAQIQADLHLSPTLAGLTTTVPVLCFGIFAFIAPVLAQRWGTNRALLSALVLMLAGTLVKIYPTALALFGGTILMGMGVAIGNVLVLVGIRENYARHLQLMMSGFTAAINIGAALGAALTIPLIHFTGWRWNLALGLWAIPIVAVFILWLVVIRTEDAPTTTKAANHYSYRQLLGQRTPRLLMAYLATSSAMFYAMLTWLPDQLVEAGLTPGRAGLALSIFSLIGFVGAVCGPLIVRSRFAYPGMILAFAPYVGGTFFVIGPAPILGVVMLGIGQGASFAIGMTLIADLPDQAQVAPVSALTQGVSYFVAALGPVGIGALRGWSGSWHLAAWVEAGVLLFTTAMAVATLINVRRERAEATPPTATVVQWTR